MREKKKRYFAAHIAFPILCAIAVWFHASYCWQAAQWANLKMNEIVNQLATPMEGTGNGMVEQYLLTCVLPACLAGVGAVILLLVLKRKGLSFAAAFRGNMVALSAIIFIVAYAFCMLDVGGYLIDSRIPSKYIEKNYVDPKSVELTFPEEKRNLVYIWLESVESTYAAEDDGGAFEVTPIPELVELAEENTSFTGSEGGVNGGISAYGTTWTAGALFGHMSGLPLKIPIADSAMSQQEAFFPGVTTIGDLLAEQGYQQGFLIGSDATFGGRRQLFSQHGDYAIWDYPYAKENGQIPENYYVWWGYEDRKLFSFAKEHLTEMAADGRPFNLSILTVDTHFPDGYLCPECSDAFGDDQYSNVMACSSRQVAEFVEWIQAQPFYENTTIVISGDHITMDADYCDNVPSDYTRRVYTTIINPAVEVSDPTWYRNYTTMDLFPTTLAALGVTIPGDRLALGTNLFSEKKTLLERDGYDTLDRELRRQSDFLDSLSGIDESVYELSALYADTDAQLTVEFSEDSITYTMAGLGEIEDSFTSVEVLADLMDGNTRTTLWQEAAEKQADGTYSITMPLSELGEETDFVIHIYAMTEAGRIRVGTGYDCDIVAQSIEKEDGE